MTHPEPLRVLVVDDYPDAAVMSCELLTMLGHTCLPAVDAATAIEAAKELTPDLVILDIGLPDMSGYELAPRVRALFDHPIVIAALTGWGQPADLARAQAAGFDHHVVKPTTAAKLQEIIEFASRRCHVAA